ncbi:hypothetical protein BDW22DRAFT_1439756 [Trametopsis cervina]|nr:hypothetical protein BDW22DRAFT_1439756 [Trametopsis cervina]
MLPRGPEWRCEMWEAVGDEVDDNGEKRTEVLELWKRNPVKCIEDLLSNPMFEEHLHYESERIYEDSERLKPIFGEMWTGEWWEKTQKSLPKGATIVPVILASDKTQLSTFSGDKSAWPVYLTIGNLPKSLRRSPSAHATVLIGYLPVTKLECFSKAKRSLFGYQLFHDCMRSLLEPLIEAGTRGVDMVCADGFIRTIYPIIAAYIADHPEQCLVACCQENFCPKCLVSPDKRGLALDSPLRDPDKSAALIQGKLSGGKPTEFANTGLRAVNPFWVGFPCCDIFSCLTPDILHQLHKGMFKDHTVKWATACTDGKDGEIDRRFQAMPSHPDLRHFRKGISLISQWTGSEYKNMEKVFVGVIAGATVDPEVIKAVRAVLDFIYYAHFETHTTESLVQLKTAWLNFHTHKQVFVRLGIRQNFNGIPKLHSMSHYIDSIRCLGAADGYSTEGPERLHIDFAKLAYRASNRKQYIQQMTVWLERQDSVRRFSNYLTWLGHQRIRPNEKREGKQDKETGDELRNGNVDGSGGDIETELVEAGGSTAAPSFYRIAKNPKFPNTSVSELEKDFGATQFTACFEAFLRTHIPSEQTSRSTSLCSITHHTVFPVFKQFKLKLPVMSQVSKCSTYDIIRAHPGSQSEGNTTHSTPEYFSTVLARDTGDQQHRINSATGNPLEGLTVGRVRAIFRIPETLHQHAQTLDNPFVYIEWFSRFHKYDIDSGSFSVVPSQRNHRRRVSIIPITDIVRTCHLIPHWGRVMDTTWTQANVLDRCKSFYVNPYLRHSDFVIFRFLVDKWQKARQRRSTIEQIV